jgi:hypothetical protein
MTSEQFVFGLFLVMKIVFQACASQLYFSGEPLRECMFTWPTQRALAGAKSHGADSVGILA